MTSYNRIYHFLLIGISVLFLTAGCGSSGGGGGSSSSTNSVDTDVEIVQGSTSLAALDLAEKISVVDAKSSTDSSSVAPLHIGFDNIRAAISTSGFSVDSDYNQDTTQIYVHEKSAEAMNSVNEILCSIKQTKYDGMINQDPYKAQIDITQCEQKGESSDASSQDQSSGSNRAEYEMWTVYSTRADVNSPHIVQAWVHQEPDDGGGPGGDGGMLIKARMIIEQAADDDNPYGLFRLDFAGYGVDASGNLDATSSMNGYMYTEISSSGQVYLKFYNGMEMMGETLEQKVSFSRNTDGSSGGGTTTSFDFDQNGLTTANFNFAFSDDYFYREDKGGNKSCLDRNNFSEIAWRYGLYDSTGARVNRDSGFPIKAESGSDEYFGYIGYWGLWMPEDANIGNGDTVYRMEFGKKGDEAKQEYTVYKVGGKLIRNTRKTLSLEDIKGLPLNYYNWSGDQKEYRVVWTGTALNKTHVRDANWNWQKIAEAEVTFDQWDWSFNFYSESLGGDGQVIFSASESGGNVTIDQALTNTSTVIFHMRDVVFPSDSDVPANLICYDNCPDSTALTSSDPYHTRAVDGDNMPVSHTYTFSDMVLKEGGTSILRPTAIGENDHGLWTGPLFENTGANMTALQCDWDAGLTCGWKAWQVLDVFYTWETGANDWNQFTTLKDGSNNYAEFEAPLFIQYTHSQSGHDYDGSVFYLEYGGFGNLHGIPSTCVDDETGVEISCDSENARWLPEFGIANGANASWTNDQSVTVEGVIKALEKEQSMVKVDNSVCAAAGMNLSTHTLPTSSDLLNPNLGDEPQVDAAPSVIGGVIQ